jgi:hypothetical protein
MKSKTDSKKEQKNYDDFKNEMNANFIKVNLKHDQECNQLTQISVAIANVQDQITRLNQRLCIVENNQSTQWKRHDENKSAIEKLDHEVEKIKERVIKLETTLWLIIVTSIYAGMTVKQAVLTTR